MLVSVSIASLIAGVSQQPDTLKVANSCEEMINGWPSVVSGLSKRAPTQHVSTLDTLSDIPDFSTGYIINRGPFYQYVVYISDGNLRVFDIRGEEQTVSFPNGSAYLSQSIRDNEAFRFLTVGDTTFILNREVATRENKYGEIGEVNFTPDGTVTSPNDLPTTGNTLDDVYFVSGTSEYYKWVDPTAAAEIVSWQAITGWLDEFPAQDHGDGITQANLPREAVLGQKIILTSVTDRPPALLAGGFSTSTGLPTGPIVKWRVYQGTVTQNTNTGPAYWRKLSEKELAKNVTERLDPTNMATVHVTQSIANTYYVVYVNSVKEAEYLTPDGSSASNSVPGTNAIAEQLKSGLQSKGYTVTRIGSTLSISNMVSGDIIYTEAGNGDAAIKSFTTTINQFSELPPNDVQGRVVRVQGSVEDNGDDYFVIFSGDTWTETHAWNAGAVPDRFTMPHVLVRQEDGTWVFKTHEWQERFAGDEESNQSPSFIGFPLNDIFLYSGRMGFLSDENFILSESNHFEQFYRTTVVTLIDSDRIDFAVLNTGNDKLYHATPFNEDVLLSSDRQQYRLMYDNYLGPTSVSAKPTTSYGMSSRIKPLMVGSTIYFVDDNVSYNFAKVWEYFADRDSTVDDAHEVTAPVPEYIPGNVGFMKASSRLNTMMIHSPREADTLFLYRYYWVKDEKRLNSWSKWVLPECQRILWGDFVDNSFYLLLVRPDNALCLEKILLDEVVTRQEVRSRSLLDRQYILDPDTDISYDAGRDISTVTLPFTVEDGQEYQLVFSRDGPGIDPDDTVVDAEDFSINFTSSNTFEVDGNIADRTNNLFGLRYEFYYEFATPYLREAKNNGEVVVLDGIRLQLRYMTLEYRDTAYFETVLKYPGREDVVTEISGKIVGDSQNIVGTTPFINGKSRIPLVGNNKDCTFAIRNKAPYNCSFGGAEWSATYIPRAQKRM